MANIATTPGKHVRLYVEPLMQRFGQHDSDKFSSILRQLDNSTSVYPLNAADELQLTNVGETRYDSCRFTAAAFAQAAQLLAPGLSKFLPDIAGTVVLPDSRDGLVDGAMAVNIWNEMVDARFKLFSRYRIIRNEDTKRIEGFVGHKHQFLENVLLYQYAAEAMELHHPECTLFASQLAGRRCSVWFRANTPMFQLQADGKDWPFYAGYYFTNGEATGTAVRGTFAVFTPWGTCLASYRGMGKRVTHAGKEFFQRLGQMFASVGRATIPVAKLQTGAENLLRTPLGFTAEIMASKVDYNNHCKKLTSALNLSGVPGNIAADAVDKGLKEGRLQGAARDMQDVKRVYAGRTLLDLFVPLLYIARQLDSARREKIEQAAFEVLIGRFIL